MTRERAVATRGYLYQLQAAIGGGFTTNMLTGLAVYLAAAGLGTWNVTGTYTTGQTAIVLNTMPQFPDAVIALTAYGVSDSPNLSDSVIGVQIRCRWEGKDPRPVEDLSDAIFDLLHGKTNLVLSNGVNIVQCLRQSAVSLGTDLNGRWMHSANYYVTCWRPSTNRT